MFRTFVSAPRPALPRRGFLATGTAAIALGLVARPGPARAAAIRPGGVLRMGVVGTGAFGKLEPHRSEGDALQEIAVSSNVYESLTTMDPDGRVQYLLAESITADDASATVWTIRLRSGIRFHDGRPLTAADVIFSLRRIAEPGTITGGNLGPVAAYERVDDLTLRLRLGAPRSWLPEGLSDFFSGIVPADFRPEAPVGTGPFRLGAISLQQGAVLERFDGYHGTPAPSDKVTVQFFSESQAGLNAIQNDQIDMLMDFDPSLADEIEGDEALKLYNSATGMSYPIQMRTDVAPFSDPRLRQALRLVVDREMVVNNAFNGYATVANDLYARSDRNFRTDLVRQRDVAKARQLVEEAGLTGTRLHLVMNGDPAVALVLAENAREIGLEIEVQQLDSASFYNEEYMERPFFGGDYWPPMSFLQTSSMVDAPQASFGQIRWKDQEYFDLWEVANAALDPSVMRDALSRLQQILFDRGSWIVPAYPNELIMMRADLEGMPPAPTDRRAGYRFLGRLHRATD